MKLFAPKTPHDPLDDLFAAALLGELTPEERTRLELRLQNDPAARAAYQETLHMHDLLEKSHRDAQPDFSFEDRMVTGVRHKLRNEKEHRETAWESAVVLWRAVRGVLAGHRLLQCGVVIAALLLVAGISFQPITSNEKVARRVLAMAEAKRSEDFAKTLSVDHAAQVPMQAPSGVDMPANTPSPSGEEETVSAAAPASTTSPSIVNTEASVESSKATVFAGASLAKESGGFSSHEVASDILVSNGQTTVRGKLLPGEITFVPRSDLQQNVDKARNLYGTMVQAPALELAPSATSAISASPEPTRKLVRNASLDLEVKSFQKTVDDITALVNASGGYVDSSNSQRGGNGKLQGTVVVKVLPEKLDAFLLKLRDLGEIKNQSVSTEDVTKAYYDTQARLDNAQRMEAQLQDLLKRDNGKVSELLQVERELGRVRGEIEQMQGELKLYDFQVQYATVTLTVAEKDLNQAAAYLLKENDQFALFAHDVEAAFAQARQAADDFKGQVLSANLNHNSGSDFSATMTVSVPPEQIDGFLNRVKTLGRIDNFTRQTERVANDGGASDQPSDETRTEKDRVMVNLTINADSESTREQTQLSVVAAGDVDAQAQKAKDDAAKAGAAVTASSFARDTDGAETADLSFRLPLGQAPGFLETLKSLGKVESLTIHRDDQPGTVPPDANAPAEISLHLRNEPAIVADDSGLWPTLRRTFGEGIRAFLGSIQTIGVLVAFVLPWLVVLVILAWVARRVYVMRKK